MLQHNVPINSVARALEKNDFHEFTHILAMDRMKYVNRPLCLLSLLFHFAIKGG